VPKSIDNDVMLVDKTFGFDTVVQEVVTRPLLAAKVEAASARKGVGLVKVCWGGGMAGEGGECS
jgi:6-phosphofructokinase 1